MVRVYKAIFDSQEIHKIMNCVVLIGILSYLFCKYWTLNLFCVRTKSSSNLEKHSVVQHCILIVVKIMYNKLNLHYLLSQWIKTFLACLFWGKCWDIAITRSLSLSSLSCKNFNVAHYSKNIKCIITKLGILAHHDKMQLQDKGCNSDSYSFRVMALLI